MTVSSALRRVVAATAQRASSTSAPSGAVAAGAGVVPAPEGPTPYKAPAAMAPSVNELWELSEALDLNLTREDLEVLGESMEPMMESYKVVDELTETPLRTTHPRTPGYYPRGEDNPFNAWYVCTQIKGAPEGPLAGKTLAVSDDIAVAGVPMANGSRVLEGFIPDQDATVVSRALDSGATILGKAVCEDMSLSSNGLTSLTGPVRNPHDESSSVGGAASGAAALVAAGEVDVAVGGDFGGGCRIPAAWTGIAGLKPTRGLIPCTGAIPHEITLDHIGVVSRTVQEMATLVDSMAGDDNNRDPRQVNVQKPSFAEAMADSHSTDLTGFRIGVLVEAFQWAGVSMDEVNVRVKSAALRLRDTGATVEPVSIPYHRNGVHIWNVIATEGFTALASGNGLGNNWSGHYLAQFVDAYARGRWTRASDFSDVVKQVTLLGSHMSDRYHGRFYSKAQNLSRELRQAYDNAMQKYDVLIMPSVPNTAPKIPTSEYSLGDRVSTALPMIGNTCPFNVTGHPALTLNCGFSDDLLPIGMMIVGRHFDEPTVFKVGQAHELVRDCGVDCNLAAAPKPEVF